MTKNATTHKRESADTDTVNAAVEAIAAGDIGKAESLLTGVVAHTPPEYTNCEEDDEAISIKFWDQAEFMHYVTWQNSRDLQTKGSIGWQCLSACPLLHGFYLREAKTIRSSNRILDRGQMLEPTNPKFAFEKAQALVHSGRKDEALALYDNVTQIGPHVSAHDLAVARRGRGFVLIELGDLDGAETAFRSSLELEPSSEVALHELQYIQHLRQGGAATFTEAVPSTGPDISKCAACGSHFDKGVVVSVNGMPVGICKRCEQKLTKRWWQFWK